MSSLLKQILIAVGIFSTLTTNAQELQLGDSVFIEYYNNRYGKGLLSLRKEKANEISFIETSLSNMGLPKTLKCLAIIESSLYNKTLSSAGAAGIWQLMPEEAISTGLRMDSLRDERYDIYKSTPVAGMLIKALYDKYKDWSLVVAAYNCGYPRVDRYLRRIGNNSYAAIEALLPLETRIHVKKFKSVVQLYEGREYMLAFMNPGIKQSSASTINNDTIQVKEAGFDYIATQTGTRLDVVANVLEVSHDDLKKWNMDYEKQMAENGSAQLKLPIAKMPLFISNKTEIVKLSLEKNVLNYKL